MIQTKQEDAHVNFIETIDDMIHSLPRLLKEYFWPQRSEIFNGQEIAISSPSSNDLIESDLTISLNRDFHS